MSSADTAKEDTGVAAESQTKGVAIEDAGAREQQSQQSLPVFQSRVNVERLNTDEAWSPGQLDGVHDIALTSSKLHGDATAEANAEPQSGVSSASKFGAINVNGIVEHGQLAPRNASGISYTPSFFTSVASPAVGLEVRMDLPHHLPGNMTAYSQSMGVALPTHVPYHSYRSSDAPPKSVPQLFSHSFLTNNEIKEQEPTEDKSLLSFVTKGVFVARPVDVFPLEDTSLYSSHASYESGAVHFGGRYVHPEDPRLVYQGGLVRGVRVPREPVDGPLPSRNIMASLSSHKPLASNKSFATRQLVTTAKPLYGYSGVTSYSNRHYAQPAYANYAQPAYNNYGHAQDSHGNVGASRYISLDARTMGMWMQQDHANMPLQHVVSGTSC